jgi:hypothetical protein
LLWGRAAVSGEGHRPRGQRTWRFAAGPEFCTHVARPGHPPAGRVPGIASWISRLVSGEPSAGSLDGASWVVGAAAQRTASQGARPMPVGLPAALPAGSPGESPERLRESSRAWLAGSGHAARQDGEQRAQRRGLSTLPAASWLFSPSCSGRSTAALHWSVNWRIMPDASMRHGAAGSIMTATACVGVAPATGGNPLPGAASHEFST